MELLSSNKFDIKDFCGHLVIMHPEQLSDKIRPLKEMLDYAGYAYICFPISTAETSREISAEEMNIFGGCACLVPVFSGDLMDSENLYQRSQFWYYIGYMKSNISNSIVPLCFDRSVKLDGSPIQTLDVMFDLEELMKTISNKYSAKLIRNNYYDNHAINKYAARRIYHRNLHMKFKIYQSAFENARTYYRECESRRISESAFDDFIAENLVCGCRVISFGHDDYLPPQIMPYKNEVHPRIDDYPRILVGKKSYTLLSESEREATGVRAELIMDVLMPVHKLLGTYFKCYVSTKDEMVPVYLLLALLEGDFTGKEPELTDSVSESAEEWYEKYPAQTHVDEKNNRLYFTTGMRSNADILVDSEFGIGDTLDYVYPQ